MEAIVYSEQHLDYRPVQRRRHVHLKNY